MVAFDSQESETVLLLSSMRPSKKRQLDSRISRYGTKPSTPDVKKQTSLSLVKDPKTPVTVVNPAIHKSTELIFSEVFYNEMRLRNPNNRDAEEMCRGLPTYWVPKISKALRFYSQTNLLLINSILIDMKGEISFVVKYDPTLVDEIYCVHLRKIANSLFCGVHRGVELLRFSAVATEIFLFCSSYSQFSRDKAIQFIASMSYITMGWQEPIHIYMFADWAKEYSTRLTAP